MGGLGATVVPLPAAGLVVAIAAVREDADGAPSDLVRQRQRADERRIFGDGRFEPG
jgi:hypothetical protein